MKVFYLLLFQILLSLSAISQDGFLNEQFAAATPNEARPEINLRPSHFNRRYHWKGDAFGTFGVSLGPETFFSVKASIQGRVAFTRTLYRSQYDLLLFGVHGGLELSGFGLFAVWGGVGLNGGISVGPITFDGSLTYWGIGLDQTSYGTTTFNPKVGLNILDYVWFKVGYSYFLRNESMLENWLSFQGRHVNLELCAVLKIE
jgi:hypothetical protein